MKLSYFFFIAVTGSLLFLLSNLIVTAQQDACTASVCQGTDFLWECKDINNDGFKDWNFIKCPSGTTCSNGQCVSTTSIPSASYEGSCQNKCGGEGVSSTSQPCWCDNLCEGYGDCCTGSQGYQSVCKGAAPSPTPQPTPQSSGGCANIDPDDGKNYCNKDNKPVLGSSPPCYCDTICTGNKDCCSDYQQLCGGQPSSAPTPITTSSGIPQSAGLICTKDKCGKSFGIGDGKECWCDNLCEGYGDCCNFFLQPPQDFDYQSVCAPTLIGKSQSQGSESPIESQPITCDEYIGVRCGEYDQGTIEQQQGLGCGGAYQGVYKCSDGSYKPIKSASSDWACRTCSWCAIGQGDCQPFAEMSFYSPALKKERKYLIYLPPSYYSSSKNYPVLYLMHGAAEDHNAWLKKADIDKTLDKLTKEGLEEIIFVMPDIDDSGLENGCSGFNPFIAVSKHPEVRSCGNYEDYIVKDLIPYIDSTYRTIADKSARGILGFSIGGHGAFWIGFRHPELFGFLAGYSGFYQRYVLYDPISFTTKGDFVIFNKVKIPPKEQINHMTLYLDVGINDIWSETETKEFHKRLEEAGIEHIYFLTPAGFNPVYIHGWGYLRDNLHKGILAFNEYIVAVPKVDLPPFLV